MLSLGGRIGVGSIAGITLAIYIGGIGSIFWIFLISILSIPFVYAEVYLGIKYRKNINGPVNYIEYGLGNKFMAVFYAIFIIICYIFGFVSIQANTVNKIISSSINLNGYIIPIILCIVILIIIVCGNKIISKVLNKLVPFMGLLYIFISFFVFIKNISIIPSIFKLIMNDAFNFRSFMSGFLVGIRRGIFATEAGIGTSSMASGINDNINAKDYGYIQMIGIYITIFLICGSTIIIILTSNYNSLNIVDPNGIEIALFAFMYHFNNLGSIILTVLIILFAISTILSNYYYGEISIMYIFGNKRYLLLLRILTIIIIFFGSINNATYLWKTADIFIAILAIINISAIYRLRNKIKT